jgi:putative transposase
MGTAYRTLVLRYDLPPLPPEVASRIPELLRVQEEFRRWVGRWLEDPKAPRPERGPLKHFVRMFLHAGGATDWLVGVRRSGVEVRRARPPLIFNAQLRLEGEKDVGCGVFVDLPKRQVRIRKWSGRRGNVIALPLAEEAAGWILARVREGGRLVMAAVWVGASRRSRAVKLYAALVFRREAAPAAAKRILAVDFNALHNGIAWAVVEGERVVARGILRPDVSRILRLQKTVRALDRLCAERDEVCGGAAAAKSRAWRLVRGWEDEAVRKLVRLALQYKAMIVADIPNDASVRELKEGNYSPERKILLNFGRLRQRIRGLAGWYGVQYREERLYSTVCPRCGGKMEEQPNRRVRCRCGFAAHRDEVPFHWAAKLNR